MIEKRVLVVDHSAQRRSQLQSLLAEGGIRVLEAASCEEALTVLQRENIPLVLTETELPSKSGLFLLKTIKERAPEVEVILITHNASSYNLLQALRNGAYDFIVRPIDTGEILYNALERAFRQIQLRHENQQLLLELERQNRSLQRAHKMLKSLNSSIERLATTQGIEDLFMELLTCATTELHAARGFLALFDREGGKLSLKAGKGISNETCRHYADGIPRRPDRCHGPARQTDAGAGRLSQIPDRQDRRLGTGSPPGRPRTAGRSLAAKWPNHRPGRSFRPSTGGRIRRTRTHFPHPTRPSCSPGPGEGRDHPPAQAGQIPAGHWPAIRLIERPSLRFESRDFPQKFRAVAGQLMPSDPIQS